MATDQRRDEEQQPLISEHTEFSQKTITNDIVKILYMATPRSLEMLLYVWFPFIVVTLFAGHVSIDALAITVLASAIYRGTIRIMLRGLGISGATLYGQAYGSGEYKILGILLQRILIVSMILVFLSVILYIPMKWILLALGQGEFSGPAATYLQILLPFCFLDGIFWTSSVYLQAQGITMVQLITAFLATIVQVFFLWLFTYYWSWDIYGLSLGYGSSLLFCGIAMILYLLWYHDKMKGDVKDPWALGFSMEAFHGLGTISLMMLYGATSQAFKSWGCEYLTILAGLLDNPAVYVSAFGIYFNVCLFGFTVLYGFAIAGGTMTAKEVGSGDIKAAKLITAVISAVLLGVAACISAFILALRNQIGSWWTSDEEVQKEAAKLMYYACLTVFGNAVTSIGLSVLIGVGRQKSIFAITTTVVIFVGAVVPPFLCFALNIGFYGLVIGYVMADAVEAACYIIVAMTVNWKHEVEKAKERSRLTNAK